MSTLVVLHLAVTSVLLGLVTLVVAAQSAVRAVRHHREAPAPLTSTAPVREAEPVAVA